jgi:hypothetical protein
MSQKQLQALKEVDLIKSGASAAIIQACLDNINEIATNPHFE